MNLSDYVGPYVCQDIGRGTRFDGKSRDLRSAGSAAPACSTIRSSASRGGQPGRPRSRPRRHSPQPRDVSDVTNINHERLNASERDHGHLSARRRKLYYRAAVLDARCT
jgi:hypothetical protein